MFDVRVTVILCLVVFAGGAVAGPRLPQGAIPTQSQPRLDDLQLPPLVRMQPTCGDPAAFNITLRAAAAPANAVPGSGFGSLHVTRDGVLHINLAAVVKNVGRLPSGGTEGFQFVTVSVRPTGGAPDTETLRASFRPLRAGEAVSFPFELRLPFDLSRNVPLGPGAWTLTMSLSYDKRAPVTLRPADCEMSDNLLVRDVRFW